MWLGKNGFLPDFIHIARFDRGDNDKSCYDANILIDDKVENLMSWTAAGKLAICFTQPWNKEWIGLRADNFTDVVDFIDWYREDMCL